MFKYGYCGWFKLFFEYILFKFMVARRITFDEFYSFFVRFPRQCCYVLQFLLKLDQQTVTLPTNELCDSTCQRVLIFFLTFKPYSLRQTLFLLFCLWQFWELVTVRMNRYIFINSKTDIQISISVTACHVVKLKQTLTIVTLRPFLNYSSRI